MNTLDKILIGIAIVVLGGVSSWSAYTIYHPQNLAGSFNPTGAGTYLTQNSLSASQTTITISASTPFNEPASNIPYTMAYLNSNIEYGTLNPASGQPGIDNSEFIAFTGITQNTNGTATLTGVTRGLARTPGTGGCVASSTLAHAYPSQTKFILSNSPCFYSQYAVKQNNETILGGWVFPSTTPPRLDEDPTSAQWALLSSSSLVTYHQLQLTSFAGVTNASITAKGIVQIASSTQAASSTNIGSSGAFDVLGASYATDTPQNCSSGLRAGGCVVMSFLTGKISQSWLDLTQLFNFSGGILSTASTTVTATTTIAANSTTTDALILNNVPYAFPTIIGASSSVLSVTAKGNLVWSNTFTGAISTSTAQLAMPTAQGVSVTQDVFCVAPKVVAGGGASGISQKSASSIGVEAIVDDYPLNTSTWRVTINCVSNNASGGTCNGGTVTVYALCINP